MTAWLRGWVVDDLGPPGIQVIVNPRRVLYFARVDPVYANPDDNAWIAHTADGRRVAIDKQDRRLVDELHSHG